MVSTLKALILKQRRGNSLDTPHNQLAMALYALNFLNRNHSALTAAERHFTTTTDSAIKLRVLYKDPEGGPTWRVDLLVLGRGYVCVLSPTGPWWISTKKVKRIVSWKEQPSNPMPQTPQLMKHIGLLVTSERCILDNSLFSNIKS